MLFLFISILEGLAFGWKAAECLLVFMDGFFQAGVSEL